MRPVVSDALAMPIVQTSTYTFKDTAELIRFQARAVVLLRLRRSRHRAAQEGTHSSFEYGRYGNPTTRAAEEKLCALEGAEDALLSSSGMNSATTLMLALIPAGGHLVTTTDCYRRALRIFAPAQPPH